MNRNLLIVLTLSSLYLASCTKKTESKDIIVPPPVEEVKKGTQMMPQTKQNHEIEWLGNKYKIVIVRSVNKELPKVSDENGVEYFDNEITVRITRRDGSDFINRIFRKSDFGNRISGTGFEDKGALLGIVYDKIENNKLVFAISVGSPEISSDEFFPFIMYIDRNGEISTAIDTRMDTNIEDEDEGV